MRGLPSMATLEAPCPWHPALYTSTFLVLQRCEAALPGVLLLPVPPGPLPYEASAVYLIPMFEVEKGAQKICFSSPLTALCPLSFVI